MGTFATLLILFFAILSLLVFSVWIGFIYLTLGMPGTNDWYIEEVLKSDKWWWLKFFWWFSLILTITAKTSQFYYINKGKL